MNQPFVIKIISWLLPFFVLMGIVIFPDLLIAASICSVWIAYMAYVSLVHRNAIYEEITQVLTMCSLLWLILLVESSMLRWFFVLSTIPVFFFLVWMSSEHTGRLVHIQEKPLRRMRMMIHVFNMYAWCVTLFAVDVYFPSIPFPFLILASMLISALTSFLIWRLYFKYSMKRLIWPLIIVGVSTGQVMWALRLMPFGYLAQGFLLVWLWYILQLFVRFHLSSRGIVWKDQVAFIVGNLVLFISTLFFIRWI